MSDYNAVLNRLYEILADYIKDGDLEESSKLVDEFGMTSLQVMEMIADIEDVFDISIPLNIVPNIVTVADLAREVAALID